MTWELLNSLGRILLTIIVMVKVTRFGETLNPVERVGLGMMGGGSLLTVNVIWEHQASPYSDWATSLVTYGAVLFLAGRTWRDWRHEYRNITARQQARAYLQSRGKL